MLKYELINNSDVLVSAAHLSMGYLNTLITSTSLASFSDSVPEALSCGGGESIAAIFFLFLGAKKLPKKPALSPAGRSSDGLAARGGTAGGRGLPVLGSTWTGFAVRSLTIAIAFFW